MFSTQQNSCDASHLSSAIVGKLVRATLDISDHATGSQLKDPAGHRSRAREALKSLEVDGQANDVGGGHGGTGDGVGGSGGANPGGQDVQAGGEDVHDRAVVGEVGAGIGAADGRNGQGVGGGSRAVVGGIGLKLESVKVRRGFFEFEDSSRRKKEGEGGTCIIVSSGHDGEDALLICAFNRVVEGVGVTATYHDQLDIVVSPIRIRKNDDGIIPRLMLIADLPTRLLLTISLAAQLKPSKMTEVLAELPVKTLTDRRLVFLATP